MVTALLQNRKPDLPQHSVCLECKRRGVIACSSPRTCSAWVPSPARLRSAMPVVRPRLLWLFRAEAGDGYQYAGSDAAGHGASAGKPRGCCGTLPGTRPRSPRRRKPSSPRRKSNDRPSAKTVNNIEVPALARVEGEGGLYIGVQDGKIKRNPGEYLRTAEILRRFPARPFDVRSAGHHRADLRNLPGGLSNERRQRARSRRRESGHPSDPRICAGCSIARSTSKATHCTSTFCRRRTSSARKARSAWPRSRRKSLPKPCG